MENAEGVNWEINDPDYYRKVLIKMTWDDFDGPSVLTPLGDFFCIGHSMPASFSSLPFNVSSRPCEERTFGGTAAMTCYFPMPFNKRAKIEIINENERPLGLFFHVDYELYHEETKNIAYFQAAWRRDMPCAGWGNDLCVNSPEVNSVPNLDGKDNFQMLDVRCVEETGIMGTEIPHVKHDDKKNVLTYSFGTTHEYIDIAREAFREVKELTLKLSEVENAAYRLATNIKKTQKRANALKNITIPMYTNLVYTINNALEEKEREEFTRLKVIKKMKG